MAKGSHVTYGGWEDRVCCVCGGKITLKQGTGFYSYGPPPKSWHTGCKFK